MAKPPIVDRNYWSNYTAEYPNAKELYNSGIWDTPNVYDKFVGGSHGNYSAIDYHPLVNPITDFEIPNFNIPLPSATPTSTLHPTINTGAEPPKTEPISTAIIAVVSVVAVALVVAGLLIYHKKQKPKHVSQETLTKSHIKCLESISTCLRVVCKGLTT